MNEAELLFSDILNCDRISLYLNRDLPLDAEKSAVISSVLKRRLQREPLQYILGKTEFMGLSFMVNKDVFIPRPETEILVEAAIEYVTKSQGHKVTRINLLDIGTGSGCIAIALAKLLPDNVMITATDISAEALKLAQENARLNKVAERVEFVKGNLFAPYAVRRTIYDIIVSNPPYIPTSQIDNLQPEIKYEPKTALNGGRDGLDFYRHLIASCADYLKENGLLILEIGFNQKEQIGNIFQKSEKFEIIEVVKDYNNIERVMVAQRN